MGTLSVAASSSIDRLFTKAISSHMRLEESHSVVVTPLRDAAPSNLTRQGIVAFTIASFRFRLLVLFHIPDGDAAVSAYLNRQGPGKPTSIESICELGNLCCGAMNRDLVPFFPCLGMSSPYVLSGPCVAFINELRPQQVSRYSVLISGTAQLTVTLCICTYADVDFSASFAESTEATGELEMF